MPEAAGLIGNDFKFQIGDGASPESFTDFCAVFDVGELGEESPLVRLTTLCSDAEEYRAGLADGLEIPLQCNFEQADTQIRQLYTDYKNKTTRGFRLIAKTAPQDTLTFDAIVRGWRLSPPVGERAVANFTLKITGAVVWAEGA